MSLLDSRGFSAASFLRHSLANSMKAFAGLGILRLTPAAAASASLLPSMHNNAGAPVLLRLGDRFACVRCCCCCCCGKILSTSRLPHDCFDSPGTCFIVMFSLSSSSLSKFFSPRECIEEITSRKLRLLIFLFFKCSLEANGFVSVGDTTTMIFPSTVSRIHIFSSQISSGSSKCVQNVLVKIILLKGYDTLSNFNNFYKYMCI